MYFRNFALLFGIIFGGASGIFSQTSLPVLKDNSAENERIYRIGEVRGSVKRKAVLLPKPNYPREALEAGADGIVKVEIAIDAEGSVVAAKAVSGNPLLYAVTEETARRTKFRSLENADPNAQETGTLTYSFSIEKVGWTQIGYDLAIIQIDPFLKPLNVPRVAKSFQSDWTNELEMLKKLVEMRRQQIEAQGGTVIQKPVLIKENTQTSNSSSQSIRGEIRLPMIIQPTGEQIALSQNLIASLQSRLAINETDLWKFNLGVSIFKAFGMSRDPDQRGSAAQILRQFAETAPSDFSPESMAALQNLIKILERKRETDEIQNEIPQTLKILFKNQ